MNRKNNKVALIFILPFLICFILFLFIPTIFGFIFSLTDYDGMNIANASFVGLENYKNLFDPTNVYFKEFWSSMVRTALFVIAIVPLLIIVPMFFAMLINKLTVGKRIIKGALYFPVILSVSGAATLGVWFFDQKFGLFNYFLSLFGVESVPWLTEPTYAFIAIVLLTVWWTMGGNMLIYIAALQGVDSQLYEAADLDGAGKMRQFFKITLPSIKPQVAFTLIMSVIATFNIYGQIVVLTAGGPGYSTTSTAVYIRQTAFGSTHAAGQACAMGIIFGFIIIGLTYYHFRKVVKEV